eukprot:3476704-Rhodomonas_salina.1
MEARRQQAEAREVRAPSALLRPLRYRPTLWPWGRRVPERYTILRPVYATCGCGVGYGTTPVLRNLNYGATPVLRHEGGVPGGAARGAGARAAEPRAQTTGSASPTGLCYLSMLSAYALLRYVPMHCSAMCLCCAAICQCAAPLSAYAFPLRPYAMRGTAVHGAAVCCYATRGTELMYGPTGCAVLRRMVLRLSRY